ncbi:MAG TPA: hypothetical protein VK485_04545 [Sphingomicrobium sp.]|nr:hypothetical protein [Sphingomicrobium sp.]
MNFTSDQWAIVALIFVLGFLIGGFLFSGGGRKWKTRYREEVTRREALEQAQSERAAEWETREKEWREQDSLRAAAIKNPPAEDFHPGEERRVGDRREADRRSDDPAV